jgi:hypothetical protein
MTDLDAVRGVNFKHLGGRVTPGLVAKAISAGLGVHATVQLTADRVPVVYDKLKLRDTAIPRLRLDQASGSLFPLASLLGQTRGAPRILDLLHVDPSLTCADFVNEVVAALRLTDGVNQLTVIGSHSPTILLLTQVLAPRLLRLLQFDRLGSEQWTVPVPVGELVAATCAVADGMIVDAHDLRESPWVDEARAHGLIVLGAGALTAGGRAAVLDACASANGGVFTVGRRGRTPILAGGLSRTDDMRTLVVARREAEDPPERVPAPDMELIGRLCREVIDREAGGRMSAEDWRVADRAG